MATLYPSRSVIDGSRPAPTPGELRLLDFLIENLNEEYEIFFQPFLNGDQPDVILMRKGGGVMIFEVKDWNLGAWSISEKGQWCMNGRNSTFYSSPLDQVLKYKQNLFDLHIDGLLDLKLQDYKYWYVVNCALYFHLSTETEVRSFLLPDATTDKYKTFVNKNFQILGKDSLTKEKLQQILDKTWISRNSRHFTEDLYTSFKRYFCPPLHKIEQGNSNINLTARQHELSISVPGARKRIKGVAGAGKTIVLAERAVNAHQRTKDKVLILTYNITLRNYIHDKINDVRKEFEWAYFHIANYHDFITNQLRNIGIRIEIPKDFNDWTDKARDEYFEKEYYSNLALFKEHQGLFPKYQSIFIDEAQDYQENWVRIIDQNFLAEGGEIVAFADEKQNIYSRDLDADNKMPVIPIQVGAWDKSLKDSFRLSQKIASLCSDFQARYFNRKYEIEPIQSARQVSIFEDPILSLEKIEYRYFPASTKDDELATFILSKLKSDGIHSSDSCVLSGRIQMLRQIEHKLRLKFRERTMPMFETQEMYEFIAQNTKPQYLSAELQKIRKNRKANFWLGRGTVKLSTIHSFKGLEVHTLFLVIENNLGSSDELLLTKGQGYKPVIFSDELVYTGISRCRYNLFVMNLGNPAYHEFFMNY